MNHGKAISQMINGTCLMNEPMSKHTTYGIGGPATFYIKPKNEHELTSILSYAYTHSIPVYFVGSGSNLLVSDEGVNGIVISLDKTMKKITFLTGTTVYAEGGAMLGTLVKLTGKNQLTGLESLIGVPGTLGGALVMNAGAFGGEISKCLSSVDVLNINGTKKQYNSKEIQFNYRSSSFSKDEIILGATFELKKADPLEIQNKKRTASIGRKSTQPLKVRSAGSVFKNPDTKAAGYYIDKAGLKGTVKGGAEISKKHANFFVNHGHATGKDIAYLIRLARKTVKEKFGVHLKLEIKTLGFLDGAFES